jgi:1-phosphofructokinase family hexose kinase
MILCVGTTPVFQRNMVFDHLRLDEVNRAIEVDEYPSGKPINVARVAHTLGEEALVTGFLGGDTGRFIREQLTAAGIPHDFVDVQPRTRTCVTVVDWETGQATELVEESKRVEPDAWERIEAKIGQLLPRAKMMVLSGSLPPDSPPDFYESCVRWAHGHGVKTIVDASGPPLVSALRARPMIVKPNRAELARTFGTSAEPRVPVACGAAWTVVTDGKAGATVSDGTHQWRASSPEVQAVNPIGSGDAVAAGLAVALVRGQAMPDACRLAIACGAANAMTPRAGQVVPADVEFLVKQIELESCA